MTDLSHEEEVRLAVQAAEKLGYSLAEMVFYQTVVHAEDPRFKEIASLAVDAAVNGFVEEARAAKLGEEDIKVAATILQREIIKGCKNLALLTMSDLGGHSVNGVPIGGATGLDHESTAAIDEAAAWLASEDQPPSPIVPALRRRFGLSVVDACAAIREAALIRGRSE